MALNVAIISGELPTFRGNPKPNERGSPPPGVNIKTFFRALDNHFIQQGIQSDEEKLRILYAQIDKTSGDAIDLVNCYAGRSVRYQDARAEFMAMYPDFHRTEFSHAARSYLGTTVAQPNYFCGMTRLENVSRALVEAYIQGPAIRNVPMDMDSGVLIPAENPNDPPRLLLCIDIIQNILMHIFMATQLPDKVYDKINSVTPVHTSTSFMAEAVKLAEKDRLNTASRQRRPRDNNDTLYTIQTNDTKPQPTSAKRECYRCGKPGHFQTRCNATIYCSFCALIGHNAKQCRKRAQDGTVYCSKCLRCGHEAQECRARSRLDITKKCGNCHKVGHESAHCRTKHKSNSQTANPSRSSSNVRRVNALNEVEMDCPDQEYEDEYENEVNND